MGVRWRHETGLTRGLGLKRYASIIRFLKASYSSSAFVSSAGRSIPKPAPLEAVTPLEGETETGQDMRERGGVTVGRKEGETYERGAEMRGR